MLLSLASDNVANSVPITLGVVIAVMVVLFAAIAVVAIILISYGLGFNTWM